MEIFNKPIAPVTDKEKAALGFYLSRKMDALSLVDYLSGEIGLSADPQKEIDHILNLVTSWTKPMQVKGTSEELKRLDLKQWYIDEYYYLIDNKSIEHMYARLAAALLT